MEWGWLGGGGRATCSWLHTAAVSCHCRVYGSAVGGSTTCSLGCQLPTDGGRHSLNHWTMQIFLAKLTHVFLLLFLFSADHVGWKDLNWSKQTHVFILLFLFSAGHVGWKDLSWSKLTHVFLLLFIFSAGHVGWKDLNWSKLTNVFILLFLFSAGHVGWKDLSWSKLTHVFLLLFLFRADQYSQWENSFNFRRV